MPTPVDGRANLHAASVYAQPLGVRCRSCERRALVPLDVMHRHYTRLARGGPTLNCGCS